LAGIPAAAGDGQQHRQDDGDGSEHAPDTRPGERQPDVLEWAHPVVVEPGDKALVQSAGGVGADECSKYREREQQKHERDGKARVRSAACAVPAVVSSRHR
jgi:hypothetical protein